MKAVLEINGMSCGHCTHAVSSTLQQLQGVSEASVITGHAEFRFNPDEITEQAIRNAIDEVGYDVVSFQTIEN